MIYADIEIGQPNENLGSMLKGIVIGILRKYKPDTTVKSCRKTKKNGNEYRVKLDCQNTSAMCDWMFNEFVYKVPDNIEELDVTCTGTCD